jgi:hypothetical protein
MNGTSAPTRQVGGLKTVSAHDQTRKVRWIETAKRASLPGLRLSNLDQLRSPGLKRRGVVCRQWVADKLKQEAVAAAACAMD